MISVIRMRSGKRNCLLFPSERALMTAAGTRSARLKERWRKLSRNGPFTNLLDTDEDFEAVARAITEETASYDDGETAIVFMGHGTEADSNAVYAKMQDVLTSDGFENYYIGTVEAVPSLDDVIEAIADKGYTKVVLEPLMVVAGDHANNDMAAADDPESWYSILTAEGYDVTCLLKGLGEIPAIRGIYTEHAQAMIDEALQQ